MRKACIRVWDGKIKNKESVAWIEKDRETEGEKHPKGGLGFHEPWQHGLKPPKRSPPRQWQIRQIRDDPWKPIGVLTAGESPWLRPAGCITVGKRSCQGQTGPSAFSHATTLTSHWQSTAFSHRTLHSSAETFPLHNFILEYISADRCWN